MKYQGNRKIITTDDIEITDDVQDLGESLSEVLKSQANEIAQLKSNLKWLYRHGGMGSGFGSGTGSGSGTTWSIFSTLGGTKILNNTIALSSEPGGNTLVLKINNPSGGDFRVKISYTNSEGSKQISTRLNVDKGYSYTIDLKLDINTKISINITDENDKEDQIGCEIIAVPYIFNLDLVDNSDNSYFSESVKDDLFLDDLKSYGLKAICDYEISINAEIEYSWFLNESQIGETSKIKDTLGKLEIIPINVNELSEEDDNRFELKLSLKIKPSGSNLIELTKIINFDVIPNNLYVKLDTNKGQIYTSNSVEIPNSEDQIFSGYCDFTYSIFNGVNKNRTYEIKYSINSNSPETVSGRITERKQNTLTLLFSKQGWNRIDIYVEGEIKKTSYIYIKERISNITWFNTTPKKSIYFRGGDKHSSDCLFLGSGSAKEFKSSSSSIIGTLTNPSVENDVQVSFGILYSNINSNDSKIITLTTGNPDEPIDIYRNKITWGNNKSFEILIPNSEHIKQDDLNKYHKVDIVKRFKKKVKSSEYYEINIYLDGVLEASLRDLIDYSLSISYVEFHPGNYFINNFEINYFDINKITDVDITQHFYKYQEETLSLDIDEKKIELLNFYRNFSITSDESMVTCTRGAINEISSNSKIPTLLLSFKTVNDPNFLVNSLNKSYSETDDVPKYDVDVEWSSENEELKKIETFQGTEFYIEYQGSSTRLYKGKNLNLGIKNTQDSLYNPIFSPNFDLNDTSSYLPEAKFTLKADVVDSSHSNNTSIGKFVNDNTTKFNTYWKDAILDGKTLNNHIKNCLLGFPINVFIYVNEQYYYLGVYNFDLGRDSYYNLGYKDPNNLLSLKSNDDTNKKLTSGFNIYLVDADKDKLKDKLVVAEISGGSAYFDFSQFQDSVLFQNDSDPNDNSYMFGDIVSGMATKSEYQTSIRNFVKKIAKAGGYCFDLIGKTFSNTKTDQELGYKKTIKHPSSGKLISANQVPDYKTQYKRYMSAGQYYFEPDKSEEKATLADLKGLFRDDDDGTLDSLDYSSASEYYTACMAFGLVDSVQKNLNIKTWNGETYNIAFYDMDTCLGIDNDGNPVNYFAFSDYWESEEIDNEDGTYTPGEITIYRDYFPSDSKSLGIIGYDIPSSYLFAVVKYSPLETSLSEITKSFPQELWASWRSLGNKPLETADKFIENYFKKHLENVDECLMNFNYRQKYFYLKSGNTSYIDTDFKKFHGRRLETVREWLTGRFRLLDAYFNAPGNTFAIQKLDTQDYKWIDTSYKEPIISSTAKQGMSNNSDVHILKGIFGEGNETKVESYKGSVLVNAPDYTPLMYIVQSAVKGRYFLKNKDKNYKINIDINGNQTLLFAGSRSLTYLSSINPFVSEGMKITSEKLEEIKGNSGKTSGTWNLTLPYLKNLELTSSNYSGSITLDGNDFLNLSTINISGSNLSLDLKGLPNLKSLKASSLKNADHIRIDSCSVLEELLLDNSKISELSIFNTPLKDLDLLNFTISTLKISGIPENWYTINGNYNYLNWSADYSIPILSISGAGEKDVLIINNNEYLKELTFSGFKVVQISGCSQLTKITVNDTNMLYRLQITNCCSASNSLTVTDSNNQIIEGHKYDICLNRQTKLHSINLSGTLGFKSVYLPKYKNICNDCDDGIILESCYNTNIIYLNSSGVIYIGNTSNSASEIFRNTPYSLLRYEGDTGITNLKIGNVWSTSVFKYVTNINYLFSYRDPEAKENYDPDYKGNITEKQVGLWHELNKESLHNVTNAYYTFCNQNITYRYDETTKNEYLNKKTCSDISLGYYHNVVDIRGYYNCTYINFVHRHLFTDPDNSNKFMAMNVKDGTLNISGFVSDKDISSRSVLSSSGKTANMSFYFSMDWLYEIMTKISGTIGISYLNTGYPFYMRVINPETGDLYEKDIKLPIRLMFHNDQDKKHPNRNFQCNNINFNQTDHPYLDWNNFFRNITGDLITWNCAHFSSTAYGGYCYNQHNYNLGGLCKDMDFISFANSFGSTHAYETEEQEDYVNMDNWFNWNLLADKNKLSIFRYQSWDGNQSFNFNKRMSFSTFKKILINACNGRKTIKENGKEVRPSLSGIFKYCTIYFENTDSDLDYLNLDIEEFEELTPNEDLESIYGLFYKCKLENSKGEEIPLKFSKRTFFDLFPRITNVEYTFYGTWLYEVPGFNFFRKRYETIKPVYLSDNRLVYLHEFDYHRDITTYNNCFYGCNYKNSYFDQGEDITFEKEGNFITFNEDDSRENAISSLGKGLAYKLNKNSELLSLVSDEFLDLEKNNRIGEYYTVIAAKAVNVESDKIDSAKNYSIRNPVLDSKSMDKTTLGFKPNSYNDEILPLIVSPDIFYGSNSSCVLKNVFHSPSNNPTMSGLLPKNLLKNTKKSEILKLFRNQLILPRLYKKNVYDSENNCMYNIYYFVPENFSECLKQQLTHTFCLVLPPSLNSQNIHKYYTFLKQSLPKDITTLGYNETIPSIPNTVYSSSYSSGKFYTENLQAEDQTVNSITPRTFSRWSSQYNIMYNPNTDETKFGTEGIDMSWFINLKLDGLVGYTYVGISSGPIFNKNFSLENAKFETDRRYLIENSSYVNMNYSLNIELPKISNNVKQMTRTQLTTTNKRTIYTSQLIDYSSSLASSYKSVYGITDII